MPPLLLLEQALNGLQFGIMLFLMAAGLTLVFGIMNLVNLAHGSLYMLGAYFAATIYGWSDSFWLTILLALPATALAGMLIEIAVLRTLYSRDHLDQVLATFGLILSLNELVRLVWGPSALNMRVPPALEGAIEIVPGAPYPIYRLAIIAAGLIVALGLYLLIARTRVGMLIRAGASNREMAGALGVDIKRLFTLVFGLGAALAGFAGLMMGPLLTVEVGMGESILILAFVVIVIGGIGSIRGAFLAAVLVGLIDTLGRTTLPLLFALVSANKADADASGAAVASMLVYILMAMILYFRPQGLFPARTG
jgi:branched-chain amino acid transport system permease protein